MKRSYFIEDYREIEDYLLPVFESDSYKKSIFDWIEQQQFKQVRLEGTKGSISIKDTNVMNKIVNALEDDYLLHSYEMLRSVQEDNFGYLVFESREGEVFHLPISIEFDNMMQLLKEYDIDHLLPLEAGDYSMVALTNSSEELYNVHNLPYEDEISGAWLIFDNESEIEELIALVNSDSDDDNDHYYIAFYDKIHENYLYKIKVEKEALPDFIKSRLHEIE